MLHAMVLLASVCISTAAGVPDCRLEAQSILRVYCNNVGIFPAYLRENMPEHVQEKKSAKIDDEGELARALSETLLGLKPSPDVILLQEIWSVTARDILKEQLAKAYPHAAHAPEITAGELAFQPSGLMILSKHPLEDVHYERFSRAMGWQFAANKGVLAVRLTVEGRDVVVLTTHLDSGNKKDPAVRTAQLQDCNALLRKYMAMDPRAVPVLAGDFNIRSTEPDAYGDIFKNIPGFRDTFRAECSEYQRSGRSSKEAGRRIDYLLVP